MCYFFRFRGVHSRIDDSRERITWRGSCISINFARACIVKLRRDGQEKKPLDATDACLRCMIRRSLSDRIITFEKILDKNIEKLEATCKDSIWDKVSLQL